MLDSNNLNTIRNLVVEIRVFAVSDINGRFKASLIQTAQWTAENVNKPKPVPFLYSSPELVVMVDWRGGWGNKMKKGTGLACLRFQLYNSLSILALRAEIVAVRRCFVNDGCLIISENKLHKCFNCSLIMRNNSEQKKNSLTRIRTWIHGVRSSYDIHFVLTQIMSIKTCKIDP